MGITAEGVKLDVSKLVEWKAGIVAKLVGGVAGLLKNHGVELVMGAARLVDRTHVAVRTADGERTLEASSIVIATGSTPIAIPGFAFDEKDVWSSTGALAPTRIPAHLVVIGGGYIGLEIAAVARQRGFAVTVLEAFDRVLARVVSSEVSAFYERAHRAAGVEIHCGAAVRALHGAQRVESVEIADGRRFRCDAAVIGIGIVPNVELARDAGLACANGVSVDEHARTGDANIFAAGDCTSHPHPLYGRDVRLESVQNAIHQGKVAAASLLGAPSAYSEVPWFWSDQYDLKLQIAGLSQGYDDVVLRGDPASRSFAIFGRPRVLARASKTTFSLARC